MRSASPIPCLIACLLVACGGASDPSADASVDLTGDVAVEDAPGEGLLPPLEDRVLTPLVNPFVGTDGPGNVVPGPFVPHGMVKVCPDAVAAQGELDAYDWSAAAVDGLSHTHLEGPGGSGYGYSQVRVFAVRDALDLAGEGRHSRIDHAQEQASPGFYAVRLLDPDVQHEVTATAHCAIHRLTFAGDAPRVLGLTPGTARGRNVTGRVGWDEAGDLSGFGTIIVHPVIYEALKPSAPGTGTRTLFVHARVTPEPEAVGTWAGDDLRPAERQAEGPDVGAWARWPAGADAIELRVCVSAIDEAQAAATAQAEVEGVGFDEARADAEAAWERVLNRIVVDGGTEVQRRTFVTALFHAHIQPADASEGGRAWLGADVTGAVVDAPHGLYVDDFCLWDTFRTSHPLHTLTEPERRVGILGSLLAHYRQGGWLPKCTWQAAGYSRIMIANPAVPVLADAIVKGVPGVDLDLARQAMEKAANFDDNPFPQTLGGYFNLGTPPEYLSLGYVPHEVDPTQSVSMTVEHAHDDACLAAALEALGDDAAAEPYRARAANWRNHWDPETGFLRGRTRKGAWVEPFDPAAMHDTNDFCEASSWIYSWFVPQDVSGLIQVMGGREAFVQRLDAYFEGGFHDPGNQPGFHVPWLYALAGRPDRTAERVRALLALFHDGPDGLPGNDDAGAMSAWYLWGALGLYPVDACQPTYVIGSPLFERATIRLDPEGRRRFAIEAPGTGPDAPYVQAARLNGHPLGAPVLSHADLVAGGTLVLEMGAEPSDWGR